MGSQAETNYIQNSYSIVTHNEQPGKTYSRGVSSHTDMNFEQFKELRLGLIITKNSSIKLRINDVISNNTAPSFGNKYIFLKKIAFIFL